MEHDEIGMKFSLNDRSLLGCEGKGRRFLKKKWLSEFNTTWFVGRVTTGRVGPAAKNL